jgi:Family of unknown function (DUF6502)
MAKRQPSPRHTRPSKESSESPSYHRPPRPSDRSPRPQDLLRADREDRERMLEQIFRVVFEFAHDFSLDARSARRAFQKAEKSASRSPYRLREAVRYQTLHEISNILDAWYREPAFLGENGAPRPLPLTGLKSFSTLAQRFLPRFNPRDIADILVTEHLLERDSHGWVFPVRRAARFASKTTLMMDRVPALLHALFSTLRHNATSTRRPPNTRCERGTLIDRLPAEVIPAFNDYVRKLAHTLLNQTDGWAAQRQVPPGDKSRRLVRAGVEVFAYVEPEYGRRRRGKAA